MPHFRSTSVKIQAVRAAATAMARSSWRTAGFGLFLSDMLCSMTLTQATRAKPVYFFPLPLVAVAAAGAPAAFSLAVISAIAAISSW